MSRIALHFLLPILLTPVLAVAGEALPGIDDPLRTGCKSSRDSAVVIGIEEYPFLQLGVPYAMRDAEAFESLAIYTLGIPPSRVQLLQGPTCAQMIKALQQAGEETGVDGTVYVYFAGHGSASSAGERLILGADVPYDVDLFEDSGLTLDRVQRLAGVGGARLVLLVDACYTGAGRTGGALVEGGRTYVPHGAVETETRATVWTAAGPDEVAGPLDAVQHGAFSYFAIGALRGWADGELDGERDGQVSAEEADRFVGRALKEVGIRSQHPSLAGEDEGAVMVASRTLVSISQAELEQLRKEVQGRSDPPPPPLRDPVHGTVVVNTGDADLTALTREAERQKAEREALEQRQAELERERTAEAERLRQEQEELERREREVQAALEADRMRRRDEARSGIEEAAEKDWLALADLRAEAAPEAIHVVEAYVDKYGEPTVTVDGMSYPVEIALADEAREWLKRHTGRVLGSGGLGGAVIDRHGYEMVRIEPDEFRMGSPSGEKDRDDDETRHQVSITQGFAIGSTEVTQALYKAVMGENPSRFKGNNNPVEQVSWHDVVELCNRLSEMEGLESAYRISGETVTWDRSANGYRLPTEAEWEYAARGGGEHVYSGSDDIGDVAWYSSNSGSKTHEVGGKQANGWGLYDMTGNVWEWVWDWYGEYPSGKATDPAGPSTGSNRVHRGGSWISNPRRARVANRYRYDPGFRGNFLGFRLARSLP